MSRFLKKEINLEFLRRTCVVRHTREFEINMSEKNSVKHSRLKEKKLYQMVEIVVF